MISTETGFAADLTRGEDRATVDADELGSVVADSDDPSWVPAMFTGGDGQEGEWIPHPKRSDVTADVDDARPRQVLAGALAVTLVWQVTTLGGVGVLFAPLTDEDYESDPALAVGIERAAHSAGYEDYRVEGVPPNEQHEVDSSYGPDAVAGLLFSETIPDSCHYRLGQTEMQRLDFTNRPYQEDECGGWPAWMGGNPPLGGGF